MAGWLHTKINVRHRELNLDTVAHLSTNRARRRLTLLIEANALTTTPDRQPFVQPLYRFTCSEIVLLVSRNSERLCEVSDDAPDYVTTVDKTRIVRILRQKVENFARVSCKFCAPFCEFCANSAQVFKPIL